MGGRFAVLARMSREPAFEVGVSEPQPSPGPVALDCLGGAPAPAEVASDLRRLLALPEGAREHLWEALGPSLREPIGDDVEELLTRFCERHEVADGDLARVIKACRFLLRGAAMLDLPRERFAADLGRLLGEEAEALQSALLPGYERAKVFVRGELLRRTLDDYEGKLVESIDWRLEHIVRSSHGDNLAVRLGALTFRYREGERRERITLHLGREALEELARACARMLA